MSTLTVRSIGSIVGLPEGARVEYRVLGKLEVVRDGRAIELGAFRQRALLALLLTAPNSVFSTDRILDELWGADQGADKQNALWVYVSGLRKALEPDREKRSEGTVLLTRAPGYLVQADPEQVDSVRFQRMVGEGRSLVDVDPGAASVVLGEALALWRGLPFEDFTYEAFAQTEIARLEELRLEAVELRIEADLQRGLASELISELESLVRQHPMRERLTGQLMLALYRSSRQADALRAYQRLAARLGEELGIEPSAPLRRLEEQIVVGDPALESGVTGRARLGVAGGPGPGVRGYELREQLDVGPGPGAVAYRAYQPTIGREVAINVIGPERANDPDFIRRFTTHAQLVASIEHPHIVPLYDFWREPDAAYVVTGLPQGTSLPAVLERGALTPERTLALVEQVGDALQAAHAIGVVHGAVASGNVMVDADGDACLFGFGLAADGAPPVEADVRGLATIAAQALAGRVGDIRELRQALPDPVHGVFERAAAADDDRRYADVTGLVRDLRSALTGGLTVDADDRIDQPPVSAPPSATSANPYKGLRPFGLTDSGEFFGRERLVERLIARLGLSGTKGRFIAVVGPSGSGKSSAVRAGLLPAIRTGAVPLSGSWFTIEMTPAPHPFEQLEDALLSVAVDPPAALLEQLSAEHGLQRAVSRSLPDDGSQLILVIDQFEELFTQVEGATANRFIDSVVNAVTDERSRLRVVITLRADFYDRPLQHRQLGELLRDGTEIITPMSTQELERAITRPAHDRGVTIEPALVAELIREVSARAGALPLLQYTLTELFDSRRGSRIDLTAYSELNGVSGAVAKRAEGLLTSLGDGAPEVARQTFLRLVAFTDDEDNTRRRVLRSELEDVSVDRYLLQAVLDTFGRHRLLTFDRDPVTRSPTIEISHEALLTEWARLRDWIAGARDDVRMQRRLAEAMREWVAAGRSEPYLLRGGVLEHMSMWATSTSLRLSDAEHAYLGASLAERDREEQEAHEREQRAVVAERRQRRRGRQLAAVAVAALVVAGLAVFGTVQWRSAENAKGDVEDLLTVSDLLATSGDALASDPELALLLAVQAVHETVDLGFASEDAIDAVQFALQELGVEYDIGDAAGVAVRTGPNGPTGVYALAPHELIALATQSVDRSLSADECSAVLGRGCPTQMAIPSGLPIRGGMESYGAVAAGGRALAGTTVTLQAGGLPDDPAVEAQLRQFTAETGIGVEFAIDERASLTGAEAPNPRPDVAFHTGTIPAWAEGRALDISAVIDAETLRSDFGDVLLSDGEDGAVRAIPVDLGMKGLVFYPRAAFEAADYEVPATWDELVELSHRMVADGRTPWCFGWASGAASGWPGTDLIESLVLRTGGVDVYDSWTSGAVGFASPPVMAAGRMASELIFEPGFVARGPAAISETWYDTQLVRLVGDDPADPVSEPDCWMYHQADFVLGDVPEAVTEVGFFELPPIERGQPVPVIGTATYATAVVDRPEVRAFVEFLASPKWGEVWAADPYSDFISPNRRFDATAYGDPSDDRAVNLRHSMVTAVHGALDAGLLRFDASDQMPPQIGGESDGTPGAFWAGMLDWVDGTRTIEQVFVDIDARWATLGTGD